MAPVLNKESIVAVGSRDDRAVYDYGKDAVLRVYEPADGKSAETTVYSPAEETSSFRLKREAERAD